MNEKTERERMPDITGRGKGRTARSRGLGNPARIVMVLVASVGAFIYTSFAIPPQPVLTIARLGSNQFNIVITNAVATTNYTLFWTPALANPVYPWQVLGIGEIGETNFNVDGGVWPVGFFRAMIGDDFDGDGVPEWKDGQPFNSGIGLLSIIIDSPANGSSFN